MRKIFSLFALVAFLGVVASSTAVAPAIAQAGGFTPTDEHVFSFGDIPDDFADRVGSNGGSVVRQHPAIRLSLIDCFQCRSFRRPGIAGHRRASTGTRTPEPRLPVAPDDQILYGRDHRPFFTFFLATLEKL